MRKIFSQFAALVSVGVGVVMILVVPQRTMAFDIASAFLDDTAALFSTRLSAATLQRGITLTANNEKFTIGLPATSLEQLQPNADVQLGKVRKSKLSLPDGKQLAKVFPAYGYKIDGQLSGSVWVQVKLPKRLKKHQQLMVWRPKKQEWKTVSVDRSQRAQRFSLHARKSVIAVFRNATDASKQYDGQASWYVGAAKGQPEAAMLNVPLGSTVQVTNLQNNSSTTAVITGRGPYIDGRIIDLDKETFAAIADLGTGVIPVEVTVIKQP